MKYLKKIIYIICFIAVFSLKGAYVHAYENSADEYYKLICECSYSEPYKAIKILSEAHELYPKDERFIQELNNRAKVILSWSKGSQLNGKFDGAIYGYNMIIKTNDISQIIKDEANVCMILSKRGEKTINGRINLPQQFDSVENYQNEYAKSGYEYQRIGCYNTFGNYLYIENVSSYSTENDILFDGMGFPMLKYSGKFYYNPITIEQYTLSSYNRYLNAQDENKVYLKNQFLNGANWIINNIDEDGALRYEFNYKHYLCDEEFKPGWVSAMAQGQALSVLSRAYHLTGDKKYINAGNNIFKFLTTNISNGGVMDNLGGLDESLKDYIFFQLYVTKPQSYTLNGHMYTLIGIYDWSNLDANKEVQEKAKFYFEQGLKTLKYILPYYDIGGFVTYDLGYLTKPGIKPTVNLSYYGCHITLLDALYEITKDKTFGDYAYLWNHYVEKY